MHNNKIKSMYEKEMRLLVGDNKNIIQKTKKKLKFIRKLNEKKKKLTQLKCIRKRNEKKKKLTQLKSELKRILKENYLVK